MDAMTVVSSSLPLHLDVNRPSGSSKTVVANDDDLFSDNLTDKNLTILMRGTLDPEFNF